VIADALLAEAAALLDACREKGVVLATAESCTGGLIAGALTAIAGSSDVVDRGFVTYSIPAKIDMLGVSADLIEQVGAVSREVAEAMAAGALARSQATMTVAVTGIAGPSGGSVEKPVGLVWFGLAARGVAVASECRVFPGDRTAIRAATVAHALGMIRARV